MPGGIIVSESEPAKENRYVWVKPLPDGSEEWYVLDGGDTWVLYRTVSAKATTDHNHTSLGAINFTGTISSGGTAGITGSKTIGGFKITFKNGLLTGFEAV